MTKLSESSKIQVEIDVKPEPRWKFLLILGDAKLKNGGMRVDVM